MIPSTFVINWREKVWFRKERVLSFGPFPSLEAAMATFEEMTGISAKELYISEDGRSIAGEYRTRVGILPSTESIEIISKDNEYYRLAEQINALSLTY